nr:bidirectional sugar transporter SWEET1-like [Ipomoea batatas]
MAIVKALHTTFGVFGNITGLFLFLAPVITFKRVIKKRSTEEFSGIPYVMTLLNCLLSTWYGLPLISPNNTLVSIINGTGAGLEAIYVLIFLIFAPKREKAKISGLLAVVLSIFSAVALVSLLALHAHARKIFCGFAAAIFSIIMYGSPLSIMVPNGVGSMLGMGQLMLYAIYRGNKGEGKKANNSVEMGNGNKVNGQDGTA